MKHVLVFALLLAACGGDSSTFTVEQLQDPATCMQCHPKQHSEWASSMHAYSSDDPVFVALNKRGQRETNNAMGTFCLKCHAPMAVNSGTITAENAKDFDPATLAPTERGVTCYFCHNVDQIVADHNNGLVLADDTTMRGGVKNAVGNKAHHSKYDTLMDSDTNQSEMCGSCHDVTVPHTVNMASDVALEKTFAEWKETFFSQPDPTHHLSCSGCHMVPATDVIADGPDLNVPQRTLGRHDHTFPGIDEALIPWPGTDAMATAVKGILDPSISILGPTPLAGPPSPGGICLDAPGIITVRLDSIGTGHKWPSGVGHDRRAWVEVIAYRADNSVVFQSGVVPDGVDPEDAGDVNLKGLWDHAKRADGMPSLFFWDVATTDDSSVMLAPVTLVKTDPRFDHSKTFMYPVGALSTEIDHISARVLIRPMPYKMLDALIASGDLDPSVKAKMKTLEVADTVRHWSRATAGMPGSPAMNTKCAPYSDE